MASPRGLKSRLFGPPGRRGSNQISLTSGSIELLANVPAASSGTCHACKRYDRAIQREAGEPFCKGTPELQKSTADDLVFDGFRH